MLLTKSLQVISINSNNSLLCNKGRDNRVHYCIKSSSKNCTRIVEEKENWLDYTGGGDPIGNWDINSIRLWTSNCTSERGQQTSRTGVEYSLEKCHILLVLSCFGSAAIPR